MFQDLPSLHALSYISQPVRGPSFISAGFFESSIHHMLLQIGTAHPSVKNDGGYHDGE
jgi:hypothetical protein